MITVMHNLVDRVAVDAGLERRVSSFRSAFRDEGLVKAASLLGRVSAVPVRAIGRGVKNVLLGPVAKSGPFKGQRMSRLPGREGWRSISEREFLGIQAGRTPGRAVRVQTRSGPGYFAEVHGRGGVVGAIQRNPGRSALGAAGTYLLATSPMARDMAAGFLPSKRENPVSPEVERAFASPAVPPANALLRADWKPTTDTVAKYR